MLGNEWLGIWQKSAAYHIANDSDVIIQGPRQAMGKTHLGALIAAGYLIAGGSVIQGMPTLQQGKTLLFRRTSQMVTNIKARLPRGVMRVETDTTTEKSYSNGATFQLVSAEQMKDKDHPPEGYTCDCLIIDEGHRATEEILGICLPFLFHAKREGTDKTVILGVGGHRLSLIEAMKKKGFSPKRVTPDIITAADPTYQVVFDDFKQKLTDTEYRQHILCEQVSEGMQKMFGPILAAEPLAPVDIPKFGENILFGIDVGRSSDRTCIAVLRRRAGYTDLIGTYYTTGPFTTRENNGQDVRIFSYIDQHLYNPGNIAIEVNGLGYGLWDILKKDMFIAIQGVPLTYKLKRQLVDMLTRDIREGIFRCEQQKDIDELEGLEFEINETGKYKWEHSDLLSAILMAYATQQKVMSIA